MPIRGFENFQCIPTNLEDHTHVHGCAHAQIRPEKILISHFWITLRPWTSRRSKLMQSCKMPEHWRHPKGPLAKGPLANRRFIGSRHLRKSLPNYYLNTKLNKQRLELYMTGNRFYIVSPEKSLNKQMGEVGRDSNNNKLWGGGGIWFLKLPHYII